MKQEDFRTVEIEKLINYKSETKNLEYKTSINWDQCDNDTRIGIVKDILAMANTQDGGRIIFGIEDSNYSFKGMTENDFKSFDQTKVSDFIEKHIDPKFACQVYKHTIDGRFVVVIEVPEFQEIPIICSKNAGSCRDSSKLLLREGEIYIRTDKGSSENIKTSEDMREFLMRAIRRKSDDLLHNISLLLSGKKSGISNNSFEKYNKELSSFDKFINENIGEELEQYGAWEIIAYPYEYKSNRFSDFNEMKEYLKKSQVQFRDPWFPSLKIYGNDPGICSNFNYGTQYILNESKITEGFQFYQSGLFGWKGIINQNQDGVTNESKKVLYHFPAIWKITEFFFFLKILYERFLIEGEIYIKIQLSNCDSRELVSPHHLSYETRGCQSEQETLLIFDDRVRLIDLKIQEKELANKACKRLFELFNCNDFSEESILGWQEKLISKKL